MTDNRLSEAHKRAQHFVDNLPTDVQDAFYVALLGYLYNDPPQEVSHAVDVILKNVETITITITPHPNT